MTAKKKISPTVGAARLCRTPFLDGESKTPVYNGDKYVFANDYSTDMTVMSIEQAGNLTKLELENVYKIPAFLRGYKLHVIKKLKPVGDGRQMGNNIRGCTCINNSMKTAKNQAFYVFTVHLSPPLKYGDGGIAI